MVSPLHYLLSPIFSTLRAKQGIYLCSGLLCGYLLLLCVGTRNRIREAALRVPHIRNFHARLAEGRSPSTTSLDYHCPCDAMSGSIWVYETQSFASGIWQLVDYIGSCW